MLLHLTTVIWIFMSVNAVPFPAKKFFDAINETDSVRASYLCQSEESTEQIRCCSCDRATCFEDCCIDIFWDSSFYADTDLYYYLENFVKIFKSLSSVRSCQPIRSNDRSDYEIEKIYVKNSKDDDACLPKNTYGKIRPIVYNKISGFYSNKECAEKSGVKNVSYIDISVRCKDVKENISVGMIFNENLEKSLNHCQFNIDRSKDNTISNVKRCLSKYKDNCDESDENYYLCKMYLAPTNGYKNKHCLRCNKRAMAYSEKLDDCHLSCENGFCSPTGAEYDPYIHNFVLSLNETLNNFVVTSSRQRFPAIDFINNFTKIYPHYTCEHHHEMKTCQNCHCDLSCFKYRTCCMDVLWHDNNPINLSIYEKLLISKNRNTKQHECTTIFPTLNQDENGQYYMMKSCLPMANDVDKSKCNDEDDTSLRMNTPVIGIDGNLYRNIFCARCNDIFQNKPVEIIIGCVGLLTNTSVSSNSCYYDIEPEFVIEHNLTKCLLKVKNVDVGKVCQDTEHPDYALCHSYALTYGNYKNPHCYMCSKDKNISFKQCNTRKTVTTWSLLISFNDDVSPSSVRKQNQAALINFCHDPLKFSISKIPCNDTWLNGGINISNPSFDSCLALHKPSLFLNQSVPTKFVFFDLKEYLSDLGITDYKQEEYYKTSYGLIDHIIGNLSYDRTVDILSYYNKIQTKLTGNLLILSTVNQPVLSQTHSFKNTFPFGRICYEPLMLHQNAVEYLPSCGLVYDGTQYNASDVILLIEMNSKSIDRNVVICKEFYMPSNKCHLTILKKDIKFDHNGSLLYRRHGKQEIIRVEKYLPTKNGIAICWEENVDILYRIESTLSLVGCSISILCYMIVLVTYCVFTTLQNTPGKNTMSLTLSLLIGDTMYLLAAIYDITGPHRFLFFCKTIAIIMHFSLVNGYIWCITISYDLMMTFSGTVALSKAGNYSTYWWLTTLCSLAIIILAIILDSMNIIKTGYGDNGICLPYKHVGRLLFYVSPIAVSIFLSFGFLIKTIFSMSRQNRNCKRLKHRNSKSANITLVALKLCFVLGIPELIGLFQIISTQKSTKEHQFNKVIGFIYTITRSFRGIFICFVYIVREQVLNLYKRSIFGPLLTTKRMNNSSDCQPTRKLSSSGPSIMNSQL